jgi:hypothetical protein
MVVEMEDERCLLSDTSSAWPPAYEIGLSTRALATLFTFLPLDNSVKGRASGLSSGGLQLGLSKRER